MGFLPHPALSNGEGFKKIAAKILSFGEDLGEACNIFTNTKSKRKIN